ncbi:MAG TPA: hypothetical protein VFJ81_06680, partial [Gemmatimonadales bacterium]|nr:hypothetical protein [Gemmatimonadales bacterium]
MIYARRYSNPMAPETRVPLASRIRNRYLFASDLALFASSTLLAFALRFEGFDWGPIYTHAALIYLALSVPIKLVTFWRVGIYRRLWRYAGVVEIERLISASAASGVINLMLGAVLMPWAGMSQVRVPLSVLFLDALLTAMVAALLRFVVRAFGRGRHRSRVEEGRRALIVGAGAVGEMIVRELL